MTWERWCRCRCRNTTVIQERRSADALTGRYSSLRNNEREQVWRHRSITLARLHYARCIHDRIQQDSVFIWENKHVCRQNGFFQKLRLMQDLRQLYKIKTQLHHDRGKKRQGEHYSQSVFHQLGYDPLNRLIRLSNVVESKGWIVFNLRVAWWLSRTKNGFVCSSLFCSRLYVHQYNNDYTWPRGWQQRTNRSHVNTQRG